MRATKEKRARARTFGVFGVGLALCGLACSQAEVRASAWIQGSQEKTKETDTGTMTTQNKFYCNVKALNAAEREHHKQLSEKLQAARKATVETAKGYEFQFSPADVSLAELSDWVLAESKCCPFFDFHIDLENEGNLLCLRLTGAEG